jgi:hypothetical protein
MTNAFTVSEILARGVLIEWPEGVAVARELAQRLSGASEASSLPDLDQIAVSPAGGIVVLGRAPVDDPVRRFGQLLQAMLSQSEPPVQLRLLISQATAPEPVFSSIRDYDRALEFFDRPNRSIVLQGLFGRASAAPAPVERPKPPRAEAIAPLPTAAATRARHRKAPSSRTVRRVTMAAGFAAACVAGVLVSRAAGVLPGAVPVKNTALEVSETIGGAIATGLSVVSERAGLGRLVYGHDTSAAAPPVVEPSPAADPPRASQKPSMVPGLVGVTVLDLDSAALAPPAAISVPVDRSIEAPIDEETTAEVDAGTYAPGSAGVTPPIGLRPQLPRELPDGVDRETIGRMELIILPDGTVESAKLIGPPRHVIDSMLLSAAKAWEFQPAIKDGRPVRYRKTVWIASH